MIAYKTTQEEFDSEQNFDHRLIPEGWQKVVAYEATFGSSKVKEYPQINLAFDVLAAIDNPEWAYNNKLFQTLTLIPLGEKGHGIAVHWLKCLGLKPDANGEFMIDEETFPIEIHNRPIEVYVFIEEYQGKKRNKISKVRAIEEADAPAQQEPDKDVAEDDVPF